MTQPILEWILDATENERRAAFPAINARIRSLEYFEGEQNPYLILAVLGCAPTAKKAGTALRRLPGDWREVDLENAAVVVRKRSQPWLGDLAAELAERLEPDSWRADWPLVELLLRESGVPAPTSAGFVAGWIFSLNNEPDIDQALRESPYTATLLPMVFEHDGLGSHLDRGRFRSALLRQAAEDAAWRARLIGGCLARLVRGGRTGDMRIYLSLYEELAPEPAEISGHLPDLLGLLGSTLNAAAALGQRSLRELDEAGLLDAETVLEAGSLVLQRTEKGLLKNQATWLRGAAKRHPERAAELLGLLDVPAAPPPEVMVPAPVASRALPPPPGTPAELAEQLAALLAGDWSVATSESVLAGLVTMRAKDHEAMRDALRPVVQAHRENLRYQFGALAAALATTLGLADPDGELSDLVAQLQIKLCFGEPLGKLPRGSGGVHAFLEHRLAEIAVEADRSPRPFLFATPSQANGHLDPEVLLRRMEEAERDGWQPWPIDFAQTLLRVPREPAPDLARRAAKLRSPMGERLAARLRDGHHDPVCTPFVQRGRSAELPDLRKVVEIEPAGEVDPFERALFTLKHFEIPPGNVWSAGLQLLGEVGVGALPSHREVAAARMLPVLALQADSDSGRGAARSLLLLAECHGPTGLATTLAIVYALTAKEVADRIAGVDALIGFGPALDAHAVGVELAEACAAGVLALSRAVMALEQATASGAAEVVWRVCRGALHGLLALDKARPGTPDLLALAAQCARAIGVRDDLPGLAELAARPGTSRLVTEARALREVLRR